MYMTRGNRHELKHRWNKVEKICSFLFVGFLVLFFNEGGQALECVAQRGPESYSWYSIPKEFYTSGTG